MRPALTQRRDRRVDRQSPTGQRGSFDRELARIVENSVEGVSRKVESVLSKYVPEKKGK